MRAFLTLSVVVLAACGGGGGAKVATVPFAPTAGAICTAANAKLASLPDPGGTAKGVAAYAAGAQQINAEALARLRVLEPPAATATAWRLYLVRLSEFITVTEEIATAAQGGDMARAGQLLGQARTIAEATRHQAIAAGVAQCAE